MRQFLSVIINTSFINYILTPDASIPHSDQRPDKKLSARTDVDNISISLFLFAIKTRIKPQPPLASDVLLF